MAISYYSTQWIGLATNAVVAVPGGTAVIGVDAFSDYAQAKAAGDVVLCDVFCSNDWADASGTVDVVIEGDTYTLTVGEQAFGTFAAAANQVATNSYGGVYVYTSATPVAASIYYSGAWDQLEDYTVVFVGSTVWDATGAQVSTTGGTAIIGVNAFGTKSEASAKAASYTGASITTGSSDIYLHSDWVSGVVTAGDTVAVTLADGSVVTAVYGGNAGIMSGTTAAAYRTSIENIGVTARTKNQTVYFVGGSIAQEDSTSNGGDYTWGAKTVVYNTYIQRISAGTPYTVAYTLSPELYLLEGARVGVVYAAGYAGGDKAYVYIAKDAYASSVISAQSNGERSVGIVEVDVDGGTVGTVQGANQKITEEMNFTLRNNAVGTLFRVGVDSGDDFSRLSCDVNFTIVDSSLSSGITVSHRDFGRNGWAGSFNVAIQDVNITITNSYVQAISNGTSAWSFKSYTVTLDGGSIQTLTPRVNSGDYYANYCNVTGGTATITGGTFRAMVSDAGTGDNTETNWIDSDVRFLTTTSTVVTYNNDGTITVRNGVFYNANGAANQKWIVGGTATFVGGTHNLVTLSVVGDEASTVDTMYGVEAITIDATAELIAKTTFSYNVPITIDATGFEFSGLDTRKVVLTTPGTSALTGKITVLENGTTSHNYNYERKGKNLYLTYTAVTSMAWRTRKAGETVSVGGNTYTIGVDAFASVADAKAAGYAGARSMDIFVNSAWEGTTAGETVYAVLFDGSTVAATYGENAFSTITAGGTAAASAKYNLYVVDGTYGNYYGCGRPLVFAKGYIPNIYAVQQATTTAELYILGGTVSSARAFSGAVTDGYLYMEGGTSTSSIQPGSAACATTTMEFVGSTITGVFGNNALSVSSAYSYIVRDHSVVIGDVWVGTNSGSNMSNFRGDINITVDNSQVTGGVKLSTRSTAFWAGAYSMTIQNINISVAGGTVGSFSTGGSTPWNAVKSLTVTLDSSTVTTNSTDYSQITTEITGGTATFVSGGTIVTVAGGGGSISGVVEVLEAGAQVEGNVRWVGGVATYNADGSVTIVGNGYGTKSSTSALLYIGNKYYNLQQGESVTVTGGSYARKTLHVTGGTSETGTVKGFLDAVIDADSYLYMTGNGLYQNIIVDVTGYTGGNREVAHFPSVYTDWNLLTVENGTTSKRYDAVKSGYTIQLKKRYGYFAGAWRDLETGDKVVVNGNTLTIGTSAFTTYAAMMDYVGGTVEQSNVGDFFLNDTWVAGNTVAVAINDENINFVVNDTNAFNTASAAYAAYAAAAFANGSFTVQSGTFTLDGAVSVYDLNLDAAANLTTGTLTVNGSLTIDATNYTLGDNERKLLISADQIVAGNYVLNQAGSDYYLSLEAGNLYLTHAPVYYTELWADMSAGDIVTVNGNSYTIGVNAFANYDDARTKALATGGAVRDLDTYFSSAWSANQLATIYARGGSYTGLVGNAAKGWINAYTTRDIATQAHTSEYPDGGIVVTGLTFTGRTQLETTYATPIIYKGLVSTKGGDQFTMLFDGTAAGTAKGGYAVIGENSVITTLGLAPRDASFVQGDVVVKVVDNARIGELLIGGLYDGRLGNPNETTGSLTTNVTVTVKGATVTSIYGSGYSSPTFANVTINAINTKGSRIYGAGALECDMLQGDMTVNLTSSTYGSLISWYNSNVGAAFGMKGQLRVNIVGGSNCVTDGIVLRNTDTLTIKADAYLYTRSITNYATDETRYAGTISIDATDYTGGTRMFFQTRLGGDYALAVAGNDQYKITRTAIDDGWGYYLQQKIAYYTSDWKDLAPDTVVVAGGETVKIGEYAFTTYAAAQSTGYKTSVGDFFANNTWTVGGTISETINGETLYFVVDQANAFTSAAAAYAAYKEAGFVDGSFTVESGTHTIGEDVSVKHLTIGGDLTADNVTATADLTLGANAKLTADAISAPAISIGNGAQVTATGTITATSTVTLGENAQLSAASISTADLAISSGASITVTGAISATNAITVDANATIQAASILTADFSFSHTDAIALTGALTATGTITIDATGADLAPAQSKLLVAANSIAAGSYVVLENGTASSNYVACVKADGLYLQEKNVNVVNTAWLGLADGTVVHTAYGDKTLGTDAFATFAVGVNAGKALNTLVSMDANYNTAWAAGDTVTLATVGETPVTAMVAAGNAYYLYQNNAYTTRANAIANKNQYAIAHVYGATTGQSAATYTTYDGQSHSGIVYENAQLGDVTVGIGDIYVIGSTFATRMRGYGNGAITSGDQMNYYLDNSYVKTFTNLGSSYGASLSIDINSYKLTTPDGWWNFDTNLVAVNGSTIASVNPYGRGGGANAWLDVHGSFNLTVDRSYVGAIAVGDEWGTNDFMWDEGFNIVIKNGGRIATLRFSNCGANNVTLDGGTTGSVAFAANRAARTVTGSGNTYSRAAVSAGAVTWSVTGGRQSVIMCDFTLRAADATYIGRTNSDALTVSGNSTSLQFTAAVTNNGSITVTGAAALIGNSTITNSGSITITGASELSSGSTFTNTGSITIAVGSTMTLSGNLTTTGSFTIDATGFVLDPGVYFIKVVDAKNTLSVSDFTLTGGASGMSIFVKDGDLYYGEAPVKITVAVAGIAQGETVVIGGNAYTVGTDIFASAAAALEAGHHNIESLDTYVNDAWSDLAAGEKVVVDGYTATIGTDAFAAVNSTSIAKASALGGVFRVSGNAAAACTIREVDTRYSGVSTITGNFFGNSTSGVVSNAKLLIDGDTVTTLGNTIVVVGAATVNNADITLNNASLNRIWGVQTGATALTGTLTLNVTGSTVGCFTLGGNESGWSGITAFAGNADVKFTNSIVGVIGHGYRNFGAATDGNSGANVKDYTITLANSKVGAIGTGNGTIGAVEYDTNTWIGTTSFTVNMAGSTVTTIEGGRTLTTTLGGTAVLTGGTHTGESFTGTKFYNMGGAEVFNDDGTVTYRGGTHFNEQNQVITGGTMTITGGTTMRRTVNITSGSNYVGTLSNIDALNISVGDYLKVGGTLSATLNVTVDARGYEFAPETYRTAVITSANSTFNSKFTYLQDSGDKNVFVIKGDTLYYGESDTVVSRAWVDRQTGDTVTWKSNTYTIGTDAFAYANDATAANRHYIVNADTYVYLGASAGDEVTIDGLNYTVYSASGAGREVFTAASDAATQLNSIQGKRVVMLGGTGASREWFGGASAYIENCTHYWVDGGGIIGSSGSATESTSVVFASGATIGQYWSTHGANVTNAYAEVQSGAYVDRLSVSYSGAVVTNADYRVFAGGVVGVFAGDGGLGTGGTIRYTVTGGTVRGHLNTGTSSKDNTGVKGNIVVTLTGATVGGGLLGGAGGDYVTSGDYTYTITDSYIGGTFGYTGTGGADMGSMTMANFKATVKDSRIGAMSFGRVSTTAGAFDITLDNATIGDANLSLTAPNSSSSLKGVNATIKNMTRATGNVVVIDPEFGTKVTVDGDIDLSLQNLNVTQGCVSVTGGAAGSTINGDITVNATNVVIGTSLYLLNGNAAGNISVTGNATLNFNGVSIASGIYFSTNHDAATAFTGTRSINFTGGTNTIGCINEADAAVTLNVGAVLLLTDNSKVTNAITVDASTCDYSQAQYLLISGNAPVTNNITVVNDNPSKEYEIVKSGNNVYYQQKPVYFNIAWSGLTGTVEYQGKTLTIGKDAFATYAEAGTSGRAFIYAAETYLNNTYNDTDPIVVDGYTATYDTDAFNTIAKAVEAASTAGNSLRVTGWTNGKLLNINGIKNVYISENHTATTTTVKDDTAAIASLSVSVNDSNCNVFTAVAAGSVTGALNVTADNLHTTDALYILTGTTSAGNVNVSVGGGSYLQKGLYVVNSKASVTDDVTITLGNCEIYRKGIQINDATVTGGSATVGGAKTITLEEKCTATVSAITASFDTVTIKAGATLNFGKGLADDWKDSYLFALNNLVNNGTFNYNATIGQNAYKAVAINVTGNAITSTVGNVIFTNGGTTYAAEAQDVMLVDETISDKSFLDVVTIGGTNYIYGISAFNSAESAKSSQFHDAETVVMTIGSTITDVTYGGGNIGFAGSTVTKSVYAGVEVSGGTVIDNTSITAVGVEGKDGSYSALIGGSDVKGVYNEKGKLVTAAHVTQSGSTSITVTGESNITGKGLIGSSYVTGGTLTLKGSTSSIAVESGSFNSLVVGGVLLNKAGASVVGDLHTAVTISGGTMKAVAGGCYIQSSEVQAKTSVVGVTESTANVTISGGVILNSVYGGNIGKVPAVSTDESSEWGGDTSVTIDATENKIKIGGNIVAGSDGTGVISGNTLITFKGSGSNLTINGNITGGSSGGTDGKDASCVTGSRTLAFDQFNGTLGSSNRKVIGFTKVELTGSSVSLAGYGQLASVGDWTITDGTLDWGKGANNFAGDKLNLVSTNDIGAEGWTVFKLGAGLTTGWGGFMTDSSVTDNVSVKLTVGGTDYTLVGVKEEQTGPVVYYADANYKFYLDTTDNALKVAKLA